MDPGVIIFSIRVTENEIIYCKTCLYRNLWTLRSLTGLSRKVFFRIVGVINIVKHSFAAMRSNDNEDSRETTLVGYKMDQ